MNYIRTEIKNTQILLEIYGQEFRVGPDTSKSNVKVELDRYTRSLQEKKCL